MFEGPGLEDTSPLKDQVLDGVLDTAKCSPYSDGKIYLAPFNASPLGLVYNKTLTPRNEVFQSIADLMNGAMTPEQWSQKVEASFTEVANTAAG